MFEDTWKPKPVAKDYVLVEELSEVAGVDRKSLLEWSRAGLLPKPHTGGLGSEPGLRRAGKRHCRRGQCDGRKRETESTQHGQSEFGAFELFR